MSDDSVSLSSSNDEDISVSEDPSCFSDILFQRKIIMNPLIMTEHVESVDTFTVVTYNILADCHMPALMDDATDDQLKSYDRVYRHDYLMEEIRYLDSDILCLQEVAPDYYEEYLLLDLERMGYAGTYKKRIGDTRRTDEGCATFIRLSRFDWISSEWISLCKLAEKDITECCLDKKDEEAVLEYINKPDVVLVEHLKCKPTGFDLILANIHVTFSELQYPDIQAQQIACAYRAVLAKTFNGRIPHILCGDFNQPIDFPGYHLAKDGDITEDMVTYLRSFENIPLQDGSKTSLMHLLRKSFSHESNSTKSAYLTVQGYEPEYTNTEKVNALDYIFYNSSRLEPISVLEMYTLDHIDPVKENSPTVEFHTDHISLKATFVFDCDKPADRRHYLN